MQAFDIIIRMKINTLRSSIFWLAGLTTLLGAYVSTSLFFPYITGKGFAFRTIVLIMLALYIPLAISQKKYRPHKNIGVIAYGIFILLLFFADIFGINPANSLWSNFERMEGFITHILLFIFTSILVFIKLSEKEWINFFKIYLFGNALVLLFAFSEIFKISKALSMGEQVGTRISGSLGNPAYLAISAAFGLFFATFLFYKTKNESRIIQKTLYIASALLNLTLLWRSETRGTVIGIVIGLLLATLWLTYKSWDNKKIRKAAISGLFATVSIVGIFISFKDAAFVQNNTTLKRLADISLNEQTVRSRFMIWGMSYEGVKERPILGYGQDNFVYVFSNKYNPEMFDQEQWFDRSHNVFFDWLIAGGVLTLCAYLSLFAILLWSVIKNRKDTRFDVYEQSLIVLILATYFVHNIFVFDNLISYISFFILFAYVVSRGLEEEKSKNVKIKKEYFFGMVAISTVIIFIIWQNVVYKPYKLNKTIISMFGSVMSSNFNDIKILAEKLNEESLYGKTESNEQLITMTGFVLSGDRFSNSQKGEILDLTINRLNEEIKNDPLNPRPPVIVAGFLDSIGANEAANKYYENALKITPKKTILWSTLAESYSQAGDLEKAVAAATTAHTLAPRSIQATIVLSTLYYTKKDTDSARDVWEATVNANNNSQEVLLKRIKFFQEQKDEEAFNLALSDFVKDFPVYENEIRQIFKQ